MVWDPCKLIIDHIVSVWIGVHNKYLKLYRCSKQQNAAQRKMFWLQDVVYETHFLFQNWLMYGRIEHEWKMMT